MAIYLGSERVVFQTSQTENIPTNAMKSIDDIAMRTISGSISGSATSIGDYAFYYCSYLTTANFPLCTSIGNSTFEHCSSLTTASFPSCSFIGSNAFAICYNLLSVYLLGSSAPTLSNINAFNSTPISNYTTSTGGVYGSIFVPSSLYNSYITANNWSVYSARIVSM